MADVVRSRDTTRLVTWASDKLVADVCLSIADVVSFNNYPGWYGGSPASISGLWKSLGNFVATLYPSKPLTISECGAGGILGWRNGTGSQVRYSEEFQAEIVSYDAGNITQNHDIACLSLWQFQDIKTPKNGRPGGAEPERHAIAGAPAETSSAAGHTDIQG